jgi:hypothetical protein
MENLKVKDEEYADLARLYGDYRALAEKHIDTYCTIMQSVASDGIKSGDAHDSLVQFASLALNLKDQVDQILSAMAERCASYVTEIDRLDQDLY